MEVMGSSPAFQQQFLPDLSSYIPKIFMHFIKHSTHLIWGNPTLSDSVSAIAPPPFSCSSCTFALAPHDLELLHHIQDNMKSTAQCSSRSESLLKLFPQSGAAPAKSFRALLLPLEHLHPLQDEELSSLRPETTFGAPPLEKNSFCQV